MALSAEGSASVRSHKATSQNYEGKPNCVNQATNQF